MEELDILDFFRYYVSKVFIVIIALILVLIIGNIYTHNFRKPLYKSDTTIVLVSDDVEKYTQTDLTFNKNLVATYTNIVKSKKVLDKVIRDLRLDYSYEQLYSNVNVKDVDNTEIMQITVSDEDSELAMLIANMIVPIFSTEVERIYGIENVSVIDTAEISDTPYNVNNVKENLIFIMAGLLLGSIIVFVIYYFDTSIKSVEMLEDKLGLTVLGMVPKIERRG